MNKLYIARLIISFRDDWSFSCNFNYSVIEGKFSKNDMTNVYEGSNEIRGSWVQIPVTMKTTEQNNILEVVQGFDRELSDEEISSLKSKMKENVLALLKEYKDSYLKSYNKKVSYIKNTTVA